MVLATLGRDTAITSQENVNQENVGCDTSKAFPPKVPLDYTSSIYKDWHRNEYDIR